MPSRIRIQAARLALRFSVDPFGATLDDCASWIVSVIESRYPVPLAPMLDRGEGTVGGDELASCIPRMRSSADAHHRG